MKSPRKPRANAKFSPALQEQVVPTKERSENPPVNFEKSFLVGGPPIPDKVAPPLSHETPHPLTAFQHDLIAALLAPTGESWDAKGLAAKALELHEACTKARLAKAEQAIAEQESQAAQDAEQIMYGLGYKRYTFSEILEGKMVPGISSKNGLAKTIQQHLPHEWPSIRKLEPRALDSDALERLKAQRARGRAIRKQPARLKPEDQRHKKTETQEKMPSGMIPAKWAK